MKKLYLTVILLTCLFSTHCFGQANINCPFPSSVTCPPDTLTQVEFVPSYENLPCAIPGIPYSQVVQVHTPSSTTADGLSVDIETITIDTISNLPCGLCWSCAEANNTINGGATGCLLISGTTTDAPGQYLLTVLVKAAVKIDGIIPTTAYENLATLGLNYYVRVSANGTATCTAVDTAVAGNTTGTAGTIAAPSISGGTTICSGSSTTLGVAGGTYEGYLWSTGAVTDTLHVTSAGTYSVTVYENCNTATASVTVTSASASASISALGATTFCQGGSVKLVASKGTSYTWNTSPTQTTDTITVTQGGSYVVTVTSGGCSSASAPTVVTVKQPGSSSISASFCANSSYNFNGKVLTSAGTYFDTLTAANGCDSIVTLTLTSKPISTTSISGSFCANSSYNFNGKVLTQAGTYFDTLTAASGCDSIITLTLTSKPISTTSISGSFCANSSYNFNGKVLTQAGTYKDTLTAANGCDSIVTLTLTSKPISTTSISGSFCANSSYNFNGKVLTQAGTYADTLTAANGCDSIVTLTLTSKPISTTSISGSFCANSSYNFNGKVLTSAGTYFDTLTAANGCDSIVTLTLTSKPISTTSISGSFCANSSYNFNGKVLTQAGTYKDTLTAANSCDSIVTLTLSIIPVTTSTINATICTGSTYVLNGKTFTANGTYLDTVSNAGGCDSIITLNLTVSSSVTATITALSSTTFCSGGSVSLVASKGTAYAWNTTPVQTTDTITVAQSGSYVVTVTGGSCSGVSSPTVVMVNQPTSSSVSASICSNSSYNFNGKIVTSAGTYKDTLTGANGCDSIVTLTLTTKPISTGSVSASICAGSNYNFNGKVLTTAGSYIDTLASANGCDSIVTLTLTVKSLPTPTITADGPTTFCAGGSVVLDAGAGYSAYSWNTTPQATTEKATITTAGNYSVTVTQNGCQGASTNTITVSIDTTHPVAVCKSISVTLVNGSATITASQVDGGSTANCGIASRTVAPSSFTTADTGNNTVVLTITDSSGHSSTCDATVTVSSGTTGSFKCDITSELPPSLQHTGSTNPDLIYLGYGPQLSALEVSTTGGTGPYHYSWSPTTDLSCDTCATPIFKPTGGGSYTYSVTVTDGSGSSSTCSITFCVIDARSTIDYGLFKTVYVCHNPQGCNSSAGATTYAVPVDLVPLILQVFPCDELGRCGSTCQTVAPSQSNEGGGDAREADDEHIPLLENADAAMSVLVYPNPFSGTFHLAVASTGVDRINVRIYDMYGRLMAAQEGVDPNTELSLGNELANGIYIIEVTQGANRKAIRMTKAD